MFGSPARRDLTNEYFTKSTDFGLPYSRPLPVLYAHGADSMLQKSEIGTIDTLVPDEIGIWAEAELNKAHRYIKAIKELIAKGALAWSSGSLPKLHQKSVSGEILKWQIVEGSLATSPAQPTGTEVSFLASAIPLPAAAPTPTHHTAGQFYGVPVWQIPHR